MQLTLRGRSRYVCLGIVCLFTYLYLLPDSSTLASWRREKSVPESVQLQHFMNDGRTTKKARVIKSSFDFSKVKFAHPPQNPVSLPTGVPRAFPPVQHKFGPESELAGQKRQERRAEVRKLFQKNWQSYREHAWMKDALQPLSGTFKDQFAGWAATLVDSLDTLWIMGFKEEFDEAVVAVAEIDFGQSSTSRINSFETTIRYLGGLLAAYDLSKNDILLQKATEIGDLLYAGFNTPNRMPCDFIDFQRAKTGEGLTAEYSVVSASPGTLSLEMTHLSQVTGNSKYYDAINNVMQLFYENQNKTSLPGMWPIYVSMNRKDVVSGDAYTLGGNADSMYEYLPKMAALLGGLEPIYETMTKTYMKTASKHHFFRPMIPEDEDILISGNVNVDQNGTPSLDPESEHLTCFIGGSFALAGRLFDQPADVVTGGRLARGCAYAYHSFPTGIMPERYNMIACEPQQSRCPWDEEAWIQGRSKRLEWKEHLPKGFTTAKDPRYLLRPEAIESLFILYRITGDVRYQESAWAMFKAVAEGTRTKYANAAVLDVTIAKENLPQEDYMESFWLAETLKYFYLIFSPPDLISLDDYVLNTEAHPFLRPK